MVGLVVVSHSRHLAGAAVALASEMLHGAPLRIEVAAGLDEDAFGTDAVDIEAALSAADDGDGVVVLMDLGSAVLSTELALELLSDDDLRSRILLCPAPLVEGLVAAAVAAAGGASRAEVAAEALAGLAGKESHLGSVPPPTDTPSSAPPSSSFSAAFTVTNPHGLHARPAARLVSEARAARAPIEIRNVTTGSPWVPANSLSRVATIGALRGHELEVRATGESAEPAVEAIVALAARAFNENEVDLASAAASPTPALGGSTLGPRYDIFGGASTTAGRAASPGIAIGPAWHPHADEPEIPDDVPSQGAPAERARLADALTATARDIERIKAATSGEAAAVFEAHLLLLDDPDLLDDAHTRIDGGDPAPQAWAAATARVASDFDALPEPYLKARAEDVRAVRAQVLRALLGAGTTAQAGTGVLIARELTPAEAAGLDTTRCAGVLLAAGSPSSHAAIIARTRGMPLIVGAGTGVLDVPAGAAIALDGGTGEFAVNPAEEVLAGFRERAGELAARRDRAAGRSNAAAETRDGVRIEVGANVGSVADAEAAAAQGADLAGLVRTEFLFLGRDTAPDADEQEAVYRRIAEALGGRRITLRTLDVGGDKPLPYLPGPREDNPFLGVRGLRHSIAHPALLAEQLRAIVRVARDVPVSIMFPMVSTIPEVIRAREMLDEAIARSGGGRPSGLQVGIMVEVPAAALKTAAFVPYVDFVSIGTNDLTQYALAAERGNASLGELADGLDPGVLRLIEAVGSGAAGRITVAVCGELAADETATPLLVGLGVRELSVAPPSIPLVKEAVRATDAAEAATNAARALTLPGAAEVRAL